MARHNKHGKKLPGVFRGRHRAKQSWRKQLKKRIADL